jgi:hypothetical protein
MNLQCSKSTTTENCGIVGQDGPQIRMWDACVLEHCPGELVEADQRWTTLEGR